ncbi:MAG: tetratricopeptide repeat protein [Gammaproteobacteria bacterium]
MTMKKKMNLPAALMASAVFAFGSCAVMSVHAADKPMNSKVAGKPLQAAKASLDAKKYPDAIAKLKEIQGLSGKNAYDDFLVNEMLSYAYLKTNNYAEASKVLEPMLDSEFVPKSDVPKRVRQLAQINIQLKNYDKVIAYGERATKDGYADDEMLTWVGQAYYLKGDYKGSAKYVENYIQGQVKAGKKPKENTLLVLQSSCNKLNDSACLQRTFEQLVTYYPKAQYWQNLVDAMYHTQASGEAGERNLLQVYRLASAVDVLRKPADFTEYAQLALERGSAGEAQAVLEKGFTNKVFTESRDVERNKRLLENAKKQAAADQAALTKKATDAAAGKAGDPDVTVGLAYMGYEQYDKAVEAINRGLTKPVQNAADARLSLGIAELRAGRKDDARKTFKAVKGDPTLERLANLWTLHSQA